MTGINLDQNGKTTPEHIKIEDILRRYRELIDDAEEIGISDLDELITHDTAEQRNYERIEKAIAATRVAAAAAMDAAHHLDEPAPNVIDQTLRHKAKIGLGMYARWLSKQADEIARATRPW